MSSALIGVSKSSALTQVWLFVLTAKKASSGKSKEELTLEKRQELERRLQDVSGQLNHGKKPAKPKGNACLCLLTGVGGF